ncbi:MAG: molybdenum cofactor guanylyltransferase MobA, partial [Mesorhizobium sp.]
VGCRDALRHFLVDEHNKRVSAFIERHGHVEVEFPILQSAGQSIDPFFNINVPDDLAQAARLLQSMTS